MKEIEKFNPFLLAGYAGPEYFCNREKEVEQIKDAAKSNRHMVIYAPRKLGKSGLIHHSFHNLGKKYDVLYVDLFSTESLENLLQALGMAVLEKFEKTTEKIIRLAMEWFSRMRPQLSLNPHTGQPELSLTVESMQDVVQSLQHTFNYLERHAKPVVLALDEFQQINRYGGHALEASFRTQLQNLRNTTVLFSGSARHLLIPMFSEPSRPLYHGADFLHVKKLDKQAYGEFIQRHFKKTGRTVHPEALEHIFHWSRLHTYYTQLLCHKLFSMAKKEVQLTDIHHAVQSIYSEREMIFEQVRKSLAPQQLKLLQAIAREEGVTRVTSKDFLSRHRLGAHSTVRKSLQSLIEKEYVLEETSDGTITYVVYDVILARWLQR